MGMRKLKVDVRSFYSFFFWMYFLLDLLTHYPPHSLQKIGCSPLATLVSC